MDILLHGRRLRSAGGDMQKMLEIYSVTDVMMNCIYVDSLLETSELAWQYLDIPATIEFKSRAERVEEQILDDMWFPNSRRGKGAFHALDMTGEPISEISISNLFPLLLPNLREEQLVSLLDLMDKSFDTPFPLPSVATDSRNYDPHNRESERLWRGPTWINTNWLIARGLKKQIMRPDLAHNPELINCCIAWFNRINDSSRALVDKNGPHEHYNPLTGEWQRRRVKRFGWSTLAYAPDSLES
jgi:hypothetical protein